MQDPNRRRQQIDHDIDDFGNEAPKKSSGVDLKGLILPVIVSVIISLIAIFMLFSPNDKASMKEVDVKLSDQKVDITKTITDLTAKNNALKTELTKANADQINAAVANMPTAQSIADAKNIATQAQKDVGEVKASIEQAKKDAADAKANATQSAGTIASMQTDMNTIKNDIATLKKQTINNNDADIIALKANITELTAKYDAVKTQYDALKTKLDIYINNSDDDTDDIDDVSLGSLSIKSIGTRLILSNIFNTYPANEANFTAFQFRVTNKSAKDITIYELRLSLARYKYNASNNLEDYDFQISPDKLFTTGKYAFVLDDSSSSKLTFTSTGTYSVSANDSLDFTVYVRTLLNSGYTDYDSALAPYYLRLTPTMTIIDYDTDE